MARLPAVGAQAGVRLAAVALKGKWATGALGRSRSTGTGWEELGARWWVVGAGRGIGLEGKGRRGGWDDGWERERDVAACFCSTEIAVVRYAWKEVGIEPLAVNSNLMVSFSLSENTKMSE